MKKGMMCLLFVVVFSFFCMQDGYAFWGRKKQATDTTQKKQEMTVEEEKEVKKQEIKKEDVTDKKTEIVKPAEEQKAAAPAPAPVQQAAKKADKVRLLRKQKRQQLNNTSWAVDVVPITGGKQKSDILIFKDKRFSSEKYSKQGFQPTNYTLNVKEKGRTVWETMQTGEDGRVVFWRGELPEDMTDMRGVLSVQESPGSAEDFSFRSREKKVITQ